MDNLQQHTCLLTLAGSRAYGTHTPSSDVDIKGVAIPPARYYIGLDRFEQADKPESMQVFWQWLPKPLQDIALASKLEGTVFELQKFCSLAADCNPNILDTLFCRDEDVLYASPIGKRLREKREIFLSSKAKHTFSGYAMSQLNRIKNHRQWLLSPPKKQPARSDFGLPDRTLIPADHLAAVNAATQKKVDEWGPHLNDLPLSVRVAVQTELHTFLREFCSGLPEGLVSEEDRVAGATWLSAARNIGVDDNLIQFLLKEREYTAAQRHWSQYQSWLKQRNPERAALEAKFHYDTKHGMHLVRLLRMGREILETGEVRVFRADAEELREIRNGAWSYETMVEWAERENRAIQDLYQKGGLAVPKNPNRDLIEDLVQELILTQNFR